MRRPRAVDVTYYEWSVIRWLASDTRAMLDPAGRGIYREIIDLCYTQGSIPKDLELLARKVDCTEEQMRRVWPIIAKHFKANKKDTSVLVNHAISTRRNAIIHYHVQQKRNGVQGGRKKEPPNGNGFSEIRTGGLTDFENRFKPTKRTNITKRTKRTNEAAGLSPGVEDTPPESSPPPFDSPPPAAIEPEKIPEIDKLCFISRELTYYVNELCHLGWQPADEKICSEILKAIEGDLDFFTAKLGQLWKSRRASPKKSYGWFISVLRKEN
jgi:hypothetical protein